MKQRSMRSRFDRSKRSIMSSGALRHLHPAAKLIGHQRGHARDADEPHETRPWAAAFAVTHSCWLMSGIWWFAPLPFRVGPTSVGPKSRWILDWGRLKSALPVEG